MNDINNREYASKPFRIPENIDIFGTWYNQLSYIGNTFLPWIISLTAEEDPVCQELPS